MGPMILLCQLVNRKILVEIVNKLGGNAQITILPGVGHNAWDYVYNRAEIYQWLLSHQLK
jgi:predicted peptidase